MEKHNKDFFFFISTHLIFLLNRFEVNEKIVRLSVLVDFLLQHLQAVSRYDLCQHQFVLFMWLSIVTQEPAGFIPISPWNNEPGKLGHLTNKK